MTYPAADDFDDDDEYDPTKKKMEDKTLLIKPFQPGVMRQICPECNAERWTDIEKHRSMAAYLFCFLICFAGGGTCCCCFIPCCMDRCKVVQHTCSKCHKYLGEYYPK